MLLQFCNNVQFVSESPAKGSTVQYQPGRGGGLRHESSGPRGAGGGAAQALAGLLGLGGGGAGALAAMASLAHSQIHHEGGSRGGREGEREQRGPETSYQMNVPNELIGSVIGTRRTTSQPLMSVTVPI